MAGYVELRLIRVELAAKGQTSQKLFKNMFLNYRFLKTTVDRRDNYNPKAIIEESTEQVVKGWSSPKMGLKPYFASSESHTI